MDMSDFPLFPKLSEEGKLEAEAVINMFKEKMKRAAQDALGEIYTEISAYIESDSWTNFRNTMLNGFKDYRNRKIQGEYDFKQIREQIYYQFRDEIIKDLDQDNLEKIKELQKEISRLKDIISDRPHNRSI